MIPRVLEDINIALLLYTSTSDYRIISDLTARICTRTRTENKEQKQNRWQCKEGFQNGQRIPIGKASREHPRYRTLS